MNIKSVVRSDEYRNTIGHFTSGVTIVTALDEDIKYGITASSVTSVSLEPPLLLVCINKNTGTSDVISKTGVFSVNILHSEQGQLARKFATPNSDKFADVDTTVGYLGLPLLQDSHASLECRVTESISAGTHYVFIGEVVNIMTNSEKKPLAYYRGKFGNFIIDHNL